MRRLVSYCVIALFMVALYAAYENTWAIDEQQTEPSDRDDPNRFVDQNSGIEAEPDSDALMEACANPDAVAQSECIMSMIERRKNEDDGEPAADD